ncbi:MAG: GHMP kinase [Magnetococcales bacterium]|nr:GHMP kinase [Magnetococcales bacterium]
MVITRTPFRVSLAGGGSDMRDYYAVRSHGAVVSAAIQSYMYIVVHPYFHDKIRIKYSKTEDVDSIDEIRHPLVREALRKVKLGTGVEIASFSDVPAGTGLGSSSAFTVGLLHALYAMQRETVTPERLASEACAIEIDILKEPIGKQDQYASAFGGLNYIRFVADESVHVAPISLDQAGRRLLEEKLRLYYIGNDRAAGTILAEQRANLKIPDKMARMDNMTLLADRLRACFHDWQVDQLGEILRQGWEYKQGMASGISNDQVQACLELAMRHGATGGKLLGAGSGGFLLLYANDHDALARHLPFRSLPFRIDQEGSKIIARDF